MSAQPQPISRLWWMFLVAGILNLIVGIVAVIHPDFTLLALGIVLGFYLLLAAVMAIVEGISGAAESRALSIVLGIVALIAGIICIRRPGESLLALVVAAGIYLVAVGVLRFVMAFTVPGPRGLPITVALLEVILGILILSLPHVSLGTLALLFGFSMLVRGVWDIFTAFAVRGARDTTAAAPPAAMAT
jgi:uncharacterized membrane protein HdeD (DUF308 family)